MKKFRIRDLVIRLDTGGGAATPDKPHPEGGGGPGVQCGVTFLICPGGSCLQSVCPTISFTVAYPTCPASHLWWCTAITLATLYPTCPASHQLVVPVAGNETTDALRVLKKQLSDALEHVKRQEASLSEPTQEPATAEDIEALEEKLQAALEDLRRKKSNLP